MFHEHEEKTLLAILEELQGQNGLLRDIAAEQLAANQLLQIIVDNTQRIYSIAFKELDMALGTIAPGSTGQFGAVLLNNGVPDTSSFVPSFTFSSADSLAVFAPATVDASGGTIPLANQSVLTVDPTDTSTSAVLTCSVVDPTGATQTATLTIAISGGVTPPPAVFSVGFTQLA